MRTKDKRAVLRRLPLLAFALAAAGCEVEGRGGNDDVQWQLNSNLRDPDERPNPDAEVVYTDDDATVSVRP
jgi:hypothetical protein